MNKPLTQNTVGQSVDHPMLPNLETPGATSDGFEQVLAKLRSLTGEALSETELVFDLGFEDPALWVQEFVQRGALMAESSSLRYVQVPKQCHQSAALSYWLNRRKGVRIATGWAYSPHIRWHNHSWLVDERARLIEPAKESLRAVRYAGVILSANEASAFAKRFLRKPDLHGRHCACALCSEVFP
ncbi:MAG: hypothetical protein IT380_10115 [Myxococcales bacterium]|nr:hypothetical protein [Myxococcales bacterium]